MKRLAKKAFVLLLALIMLFSVAMPIFAEDSEEKGASYLTGIVAGGVILAISVIIILTIDRQRSVRIAETIRQKNVELAYAVAEAEYASNAKSEFLSSMSHDIRTPLNAIIGMTEIGLRHGDDPEQMLRCLEKIRLSSTHLLSLVGDILDIGKIEAGKLSLNIAEFSIVELANTLIGLVREQAKAKNIDLIVHMHHFEQEYMMGDALRIRQVCINLITNAIKYTPAGGEVVLDFRQDTVSAMPSMLRLTFTVKDNGIGMSEEFQEVMYESFSRAVDNRVNKTPGSGLGLYICRQMVHLMGGKIECESELGKGTRFTVSLLMERGRPDEEYKLPPMKVLVADHDLTSTATLKKIFDKLGVETDVVNTAGQFEAIEGNGAGYKAAVLEYDEKTKQGIKGVTKLRKIYGEDFPILLTDIADMTEYADQIKGLNIKYTLNKPYFYRPVYEAMCKMLGLGEGKAEAAGASEKSIEGMKVLVAEDNEMNWEIVSELLGMYGVSSDHAENGAECLRMLDNAVEGSYEAVLMDGRMPVMDGLEAIRRIRSSQKLWLSTIPVIAMTADAYAEDIQNYMEAGADEHMAKPIDVNRLLAILLKFRSKTGG